ncbi:alpha/beta hydrolase [Nonomuraea cavernae]|uniref:Alpha/beta hydrolase n=1 Tax=Nonomuraea cavernae TaxID=2045107 RepID=A0A918DPU1_9ACTN|nr:alpha/beta hydrolase [Nonomuraea cavernae]MCA2189390.1 alpha/beta hydrolase [Nonomuraea cavernae]GGO76924.1 alpha/beta hydrolase [Nonomuraea cavernae]
MVSHPNLDPELRAGLEELFVPVFDASTATMESIAGHRAGLQVMLAGIPAPESDVVIENRHVPHPDGGPGLRLRVYQPAGSGTGWPCFYWVHGGGMILGTPEMDDHTLVGYVERLGCVVVSVDYRLAPEHPHPVPVEDCYAGLVWTAEHAAELGIDLERLAVGGMSAGGGLAAATVLLARDRGGPAVAFQLLLSPMLDDRNATPSSHEFTESAFWNREANLFGWTALLGDRMGGDDVSPYAAPARAEDLSGLPPAFIDVAELEVFRDEDLDYARRLVQAGVSTEFHLYPGGFHGFDALIPATELSRRAVETRFAALSRAFQR